MGYFCDFQRKSKTMVNSVKMAALGREPREYEGKTSWWELTTEEKEAFTEKRIQKIKNSDLPDATKQGLLLAGGMSGAGSAAAFKRYVEGDEQWFA